MNTLIVIIIIRNDNQDLLIIISKVDYFLLALDFIDLIRFLAASIPPLGTNSGHEESYTKSYFPTFSKYFPIRGVISIKGNYCQ